MRIVRAGIGRVDIGRLTDNEARAFAFDVTEMLECMDDGYNISCYATAPNSNDAYLIPPDKYYIEGTDLIWIITDVETAQTGTGKFAITLYNDHGQVVNSQIYKTRVDKSLIGDADPPDAWDEYLLTIEALRDETLDIAEDLVDDVTALKEQAEDARDDAQDYADRIENMTATASVDANVGVPTVTITKTENPLNLDFAFSNIKGAKGDTGDKGDKGDTGATGSTGATGNGIASISKTGTSGLIDTYTITYTDGTTDTFTVTNGAKGETGDGWTQAQTYADNASASAIEAESYSSSAEGFKNEASDYADNASESALVAEGYALGMQNGISVSEGKYFENNSKYYAEQSALSAEEAKEWVETFFAELNVNTWGGVSKIIKLGYAPILYPVGTQFITHRVTNSSVSKGASTGITSVSIDVDKYLETMGEAHSTDEFTYDGAWHYDGKAVSLSDYGLTVTGTPDEGDQIIVTFTLEEFVWDVIGHDMEVFSDPSIKHSMTLQMHNCYASLVFDAREALFAFPDGLEAGTYHFTIAQDSWVSGDAGKALQFTISRNIPAGGQLCFSSSYNATMVGSAVQIYASPLDTSAQETTTFSEGSDGTDLGSVSNAINGNINSLQRAKLGNNRYSQSAIRQVINSSSAPYGWTPQNIWDRISNNSVSGLLYRHDPDFVKVLGTPTETTALNTVSDGGGSETTEDKVFLVSRSQAFGIKENNIDEGEYYPYYSDDSGRTVKYRNGSATYWWLRSPDAGNASNVRSVGPSGSLSGGGANNGLGSAPACSLI